MLGGTGDRGDTDHDLLVALRHPLRRSILKAMAAHGDPISPRQISEAIGLPLSNTSYHIRVLADCDAVELINTSPARGSVQHFYKMTIEEPWALGILGIDEKHDGAAD